MKKSEIKEYGLRKLNGILKYGDKVQFTVTPTIDDEDEDYIEVEEGIEYHLVYYYMSTDLIERAYIHHYNEDEEYIDTYKVKPTKKEMEELEIMCDNFGWNGVDDYEEDDECICLGDGVEYEEGNEESLLNALEQLMKNIETAEKLSR